MPYELDRPLYLTADKNSVVEEGDPNAAYVLGAKGSTIDDAEAERLGLSGEKGGKQPAANKARSAGENKAKGEGEAADGAELPAPNVGAGVEVGPATVVDTGADANTESAAKPKAPRTGSSSTTGSTSGKSTKK